MAVLFAVKCNVGMPVHILNVTSGQNNEYLLLYLEMAAIEKVKVVVLGDSGKSHSNTYSFHK